MKNLSAVCLLVNNFSSSMAFYRDKLGLEVNSIDGKFADFKIDGTSLGIFEKGDAIAMFPAKYMKSGGGAIIAYQVKDIEKEIKRLKNNEVEIFEGPKTTEWGQRVAYFNDPDQNIWEISE